MAHAVKVVRAVPGASTLRDLLTSFSRREGYVTAFSNSLLHTCRTILDDHGIASLDLIEFGRLVREMLVLAGEPAPLIAASGHIREAVAQACTQLPYESPYAFASRFGGAQTALVETLGELADYGIDAKHLAEAMPAAGESLRPRIESLAWIARERDRLLEELGRQVSSLQTQACLDVFPDLDGQFSRLLVLAGDEIPPLKREWLDWAASLGMDVTVVIDGHARHAPIFPFVDDLPADREIGEGNRLLNHLFADRPDDHGAVIDLQITSCPDPLSECEWTLRECLRHPDSAIFVRDLDGYAPLLESAAMRLGVPVQLWRRVPLLTNAYAQLTMQVLEFCRGNDVRKLSAILRSRYLGLDHAQREAITEALRQAFRQRDRQWEAIDEWASQQNESLGWISALLAWRRRAFSSSFTLRDWLILLTEVTSVDAKYPWSTKGEGGDALLRERDLRARNRMEQLLADHLSIARAANVAHLSFRQMVEVCLALWDAADVSVPSASMGVPVSNTAEGLLSCRTLHVMGMVEGVFPRRRTEDPVLTDDERIELSQIIGGVPLPTSHQKIRRERSEFYKVCSAASERIMFSYPTTDDQRDNIPAFYLEAIEAVNPCRTVIHRRNEVASADPACQSDFDRRLVEALARPLESPLPNRVDDVAARAAVIPAQGLASTPRQLQDALQCPFRFVAQHVLRLQVNRSSARWSRLRSLPQRARLATQATPESAAAALRSAVEGLLDEMYGDIDLWETGLLRAGAERLIEDWVQREFATRSVWPKTTIAAPARFGEELRSRMPRGLANIAGQVDAVSEMGLFRVAHVVRRLAPEPDSRLGSERFPEDEMLYYGVLILSLLDQGRLPAIEVESEGALRTLLVVGREPNASLRGDIRSGLKVVDLGDAENPVTARNNFFKLSEELLEKAIGNIQRGTMAPQPGEHCTTCNYGELCRRSHRFSEDDHLLGAEEEDPFE